jgi:hypothetical protein
MRSKEQDFGMAAGFQLKAQGWIEDGIRLQGVAPSAFRSGSR